MATDIWIHIEYQSRKKKYRYIHANVELNKARVYSLFGAIAGVRQVGYIDPIYEPRGLPDDITEETWKEYKDGGFHTASWLTSKELRECMDLVVKQYTTKYGFSEETVRKWLEPYEFIYKYMKNSDDEGEPSRMIFWFDN